MEIRSEMRGMLIKSRALVRRGATASKSLKNNIFRLNLNLI